MISDFVPRGYGLNDEQRGELRRRIHQQRVIYILPLAWFMGAVFGALFYCYGDFAGRAPLAIPIGIIAGLAGNVVLSVIVGRMLRPFVLEQLMDFGVEICPNCGYSMHGLNKNVDHCPECGAARRDEAPGRRSRSRHAR
jgi:hypothetical protein